jgi:hypothetical protein
MTILQRGFLIFALAVAAKGGVQDQLKSRFGDDMITDVVQSIG